MRILAVLTMAFLILGASIADAKIVTEKVKYKDGKTKLVGYMAYDDSFEGKRPAVMVVHEWWGLNDNAKKRAEMLAELGYLAFAVDMYGNGKVISDMKEASHLSSLYRGDRKLMRQRANAGLKVLEKHKLYGGKTVAIGYCFGGTAVLEMARGGLDVLGVASFHGGLAPGEIDNEKITADVIVFHGGSDGFIKPEDITNFKKEMTDAGASWQFVTYGGAVHSFTVKEAGDDPSKGAAYNEQADKRSWSELKRFLKEIFE